MDANESLEHAQKLVSAVGGEMVSALVRRRRRAGAVASWIARLQRAVEMLRSAE